MALYHQTDNEENDSGETGVKETHGSEKSASVLRTEKHIKQRIPRGTVGTALKTVDYTAEQSNIFSGGSEERSRRHHQESGTAYDTAAMNNFFPSETVVYRTGGNIKYRAENTGDAGAEHGEHVPGIYHRKEDDYNSAAVEHHF